MNPIHSSNAGYLSESSILARNKVLRQTYILLALNVVFSAFCAYVGMKLNLGRLSWFLSLGAMFILIPAIQAKRNSGAGIVLLFALTGVLGLSVSYMLHAYVSAGLGSVVVKALLGSAVIFFGLSAYALISGKNFTFLGGFLFVGLCVGILASVGAALFDMTVLQVATSAAFLLIFSGYVLYDTSEIIHGAETNYISATLSLFLDIFNIFISLLSILGASRD